MTTGQRYYLDRVGRPKDLETHQFIPKTVDISGWTQVERPLSRAELLERAGLAGDGASSPAPRVIDLGDGAPPPELGAGDDEDDEDTDDDVIDAELVDDAPAEPPSSSPPADPPPAQAGPPSPAEPGNGAEPPRVVDFAAAPSGPTDGAPENQPPPANHPQGGPVPRCGVANCTNCTYARDRCTISGKPIRPPPPLDACRTDVATLFGMTAGATSMALTKFFGVPFHEALQALAPDAEEIERVAIHAQIVEHRYFGGALAEHAELRAMFFAAGSYFARVGMAAKELVEKHGGEQPAGDGAAEHPQGNGHDTSAPQPVQPPSSMSSS